MSVLKVGCFLLFAKQFGLVNTNIHLSHSEFPLLFKKVSGNSRELNLVEFKETLRQLALLMYKEEEGLSEQEKLEKFYRFLGVDNFAKCFSKLQLISKPFNIKEDIAFRIIPRHKQPKAVLAIVRKETSVNITIDHSK